MKIKIILSLVLFIGAGIFVSEFALRSSANESNNPTDNPPRALAASIVTSEFATIQWRTMVNNGSLIPGSTLNFSSYGQPSVNTSGLVVFRARSTGGGTDSGGSRKTGIYARQFGGGAVQTIADLDFMVPYPNNLNTEFTEFPSIPRISLNTPNIATRGNHQPVYNYLLPDGTETRAGTTGIYAKLGISPLITAASKLGNIPGFEAYAVPNIYPYLQFDVFPGSPAITDDAVTVFKGNYTVNGIAKTGVFFRRMIRTPGGGPFSVQLIANSDTRIPNLPPGAGDIRFGSTAPPTAVGNRVVFVGLDNEDNPTYGGIYMTPVQSNPTLRTLVGIGEQLPGLQTPAITRLGESFII